MRERGLPGYVSINSKSKQIKVGLQIELSSANECAQMVAGGLKAMTLVVVAQAQANTHTHTR